MKKLLLLAVLTAISQLNGAADEQFKPLPLVPAPTQLQPLGDYMLIKREALQQEANRAGVAPTANNSGFGARPTAEQIQRLKNSPAGLD